MFFLASWDPIAFSEILIIVFFAVCSIKKVYDIIASQYSHKTAQKFVLTFQKSQQKQKVIAKGLKRLKTMLKVFLQKLPASTVKVLHETEQNEIISLFERCLNFNKEMHANFNKATRFELLEIYSREKHALKEALQYVQFLKDMSLETWPNALENDVKDIEITYERYFESITAIADDIREQQRSSYVQQLKDANRKTGRFSTSINPKIHYFN